MGQNRTGRKGSQSPEAEKTPETEAPRNSQSNRFGLGYQPTLALMVKLVYLALWKAG